MHAHLLIGRCVFVAGSNSSGPVCSQWLALQWCWPAANRAGALRLHASRSEGLLVLLPLQLYHYFDGYYDDDDYYYYYYHHYYYYYYYYYYYFYYYLLLLTTYHLLPTTYYLLLTTYYLLLTTT